MKKFRALTVVGIAPMVAKTLAFKQAYKSNAKAEAQKAAQRILDDATQNVHVLSGNLKASGRLEEVPTGDDDKFEFDVVFGGEMGIDRFVDYAAYEEALHPYLQPAGSAAGPGWEEAATTAFDAST